MCGKYLKFLYSSIAVAAIVSIASLAHAISLYTVNLRGASPDPSPTPFIAFQVTPEDSNNDTWFETVLRINVGDPALGNPFDVAEFQVKYGAEANWGNS